MTRFQRFSPVWLSSHRPTRCLRRSFSGTTRRRRPSQSSCSCWETRWSCKTSRGENQPQRDCETCYDILIYLLPSPTRPVSLQVPGWPGCVSRSDRFSVHLHHPQAAGNHVPRLHQTALHRGRHAAGRRNNRQLLSTYLLLCDATTLSSSSRENAT